MNRNELKTILVTERFNEQCYDLDGGRDECRVTLGREQGAWTVYFVERGLIGWRETFASEDEACRFLLNDLRASALRGAPITRKD